MSSWQCNYRVWVLQSIHRVTEYRSYGPIYRIERYGDHGLRSNNGVLSHCYLKDRELYFLVYWKDRCDNEGLVFVTVGFYLVGLVVFFFKPDLIYYTDLLLVLPGTVTHGLTD